MGFQFSIVVRYFTSVGDFGEKHESWHFLDGIYYTKQRMRITNTENPKIGRIFKAWDGLKIYIQTHF